MSHDQDKKCLDDSIMVDTSTARSPGLGATAAYRRIMSIYPTPVRP
jgi:hypothetical protein